MHESHFITGLFMLLGAFNSFALGGNYQEEIIAIIF